MNPEPQEKQQKRSESFKYENCFVAFLDILGFKNKVLESQNSAETLKILIDSLNICGAFPSGGKKVSTASGTQRTISIQSRFFSDTIVFFLKEHKKDISHLFLIIRYLQDRLWEKGICLRGAVTKGEMYWPSTKYKKGNIVVGPGLIDAYKLESKVAIYPRILVSKQLYSYIESNKPSAYPFGETGQLEDFIRQDNDGMYFLDLLNRQIIRATDEELMKREGAFSIQWTADSASNYNCILSRIGTLIEENSDSKNIKIRQKYQWLKTYKDINNGYNDRTGRQQPRCGEREPEGA